MYKISYNEYVKKINGGFFGKCFGGSAGGPFEGLKTISDIGDFKDFLAPDVPNDDLDVQLLWLDVMQKKGLDITARDLTDAWDEFCWYPMCEFGLFLKNYERGIYPPYSGRFNNPNFCEGGGAPMRSEIWGFIFPGNPDLAAKYAGMDGIIDHYGNSVWIEQFYSSMISMAFFINDIKELINVGLKYLPEGSRPRNCVLEMLDCFEKDDSDWMKARRQAIRYFGHNDFTNSTLSLAFAIIGLLYGKNDMADTVKIALKCGYDTDSTCASAAALLGTIIGYDLIDDDIKKLVDDKLAVGINVKRDNNSIEYLSKETGEIGIEAASSINNQCRILDIPEDMKIPVRKKAATPIEIKIEYKNLPAIGFRDKCNFDIIINNNTSEKITGNLEMQGIPEGWGVIADKYNLVLEPHKQHKVSNSVFTNNAQKEIKNTNILDVEFVYASGKVRNSFGIAGASVWKLAGPFIDQPDKKEELQHNEDRDSEILARMFNNAAYLEKEYIDESSISSSILKEDCLIINAYEDMIPVDDNLSYCGQGCVYLLQEIISPEDREVYFVIGNNDGYRLWVNDELMHMRDEIRLWTPYNNSLFVKLRQGKNTIAIKLLRRTDNLKFSIGIRKYNGQHWHMNRWFVDFISAVFNTNMEEQCNGKT